MADFSCNGKVVIITGGSGAIGGSLAENFASNKSRLVLINRSKEKNEEKVRELRKINPDVIGIACDVMDVNALKDAGDQIIERFGRIDVLINAAGGNIPEATQNDNQTIFDMEIPSIAKVIDLNMHGAIYPSLIFGEIMAKAGSGSIINISSMATYSTISRVMGYSVGKSATNSFTQWLACEMAMKFGDKVRVNAIAPGFFIGDQNRKLLINDDGSLTARSQKIINKTPMGRFGDISELNGAVQFLCSDAASFITGVVLPIDGGFSSFSGV